MPQIVAVREACIVFAGMPLECVEAVIEMAEILGEKVDTYEVSEEYREQGVVERQVGGDRSVKEFVANFRRGSDRHRNLIERCEKN